MDKKVQKKKDRQKRVKKQVQKQREALRKDRKERETKERLMYLTRMKKTPIVRKQDSFLVRNNKILQKAMAEHEALLKFREEHKEQAEEMFEKAREEQAKYKQLIQESEENDARNDDVAESAGRQAEANG